MSNAARDRIVIHDLKVACVIGIRPEERHREQPLTVNLELEVDSRPAGRSGKISETVNYAEVAQEIGALLRFRRYRLLEMAAEELSAMIFGVHPEVHGLTLELAKPRALEGRAASASVRVSRRPEDFPRRHEDNEFGQVDVLFESREAGLYLLHIEPGKCIPSHYHQVMRELEWVVRGEIARDGKALEGLAPVAWATLLHRPRMS